MKASLFLDSCGFSSVCKFVLVKQWRQWLHVIQQAIGFCWEFDEKIDATLTKIGNMGKSASLFFSKVNKIQSLAYLKSY